MIVSTILDYSCTEGNAKLIAADADLLTMLMYVCNNIIGDINMYSEDTKKHKPIKCDIGNTTEHISDVRK